MKRLLIAALLLVAACTCAAGAPPRHAAANSLARARNAHAAAATDAAMQKALAAAPRYRFENFTTANGLPNDHVYSVLVDGDRIWAGTDDGLAEYENGRWKVYTVADGLAQQAVLSLALDKRTDSVWAGTMGGLSRISAGRIDTFTQLNSGLSNNVVYGVAVEGDNVWVATAAGACRLNTRSGQWSLWN